MKDVDDNKCGGPDNLDPHLLKISADIIAATVTHIFSRTFSPAPDLKLGQLPVISIRTEAWKTGLNFISVHL